MQICSIPLRTSSPGQGLLLFPSYSHRPIPFIESSIVSFTEQRPVSGGPCKPPNTMRMLYAIQTINSTGVNIKALLVSFLRGTWAGHS